MSAHDQTDPRTAWFNVLKNENCVQVRRLLSEDTELLKVGWEDLPASEYPRGWNTRTALHVAARRGDAELVKQILEILCPKSTGISMDSKQGRGNLTDFKLLEVKDGDYDLDALAMAVVNGNQTIVNLLKKASRDCTSNPYDIGHEEVEKDAPQLDTTAANNISNIFSEVLSANNADLQEKIQNMYVNDCDFNFLDKAVYLFHFTFSAFFTNEWRRDFIRPIQQEIFSQAKRHPGLLEVLLLELKDGQGRTALHVAVDYNNVHEFLEVIRPDKGEEPLLPKFLNVGDSAGRTPLYRAAAKNLTEQVKWLLEDHRVDVYAEIKYDAHLWGTGLDIDGLSCRNNFKSDCVYVLLEKLMSKGFNNANSAQDGPGPTIPLVEVVCSTALHVSIIHKNEKIVKQLTDYIEGGHKTEINFPACSRRYTWPIGYSWRDNVSPYSIIRRVSTMNLAVLVGDIPCLQHLLKAEESLRKPNYFSQCLDAEGFQQTSSFLLAAAIGNPGCVKAFLDSKDFDPMTIDRFSNTALHHALRGRRREFYPHLIDFVGCQHVFMSRWENDDWISWWLANPEKKVQEVRDMEKDDDVPNRETAEVLRVLKEIKLSVVAKDNLGGDIQDIYGQRHGSINLLLQAGIDLWKKNNNGRTCGPDHDAPKSFANWWYEKVAEETKAVQDKLGAAANAIAVTASLVATASYVGPVTPPLGYGGDPPSVQVGISAVRAFVIFDSLSFYFALSALVLALIPAIPLETESMIQELRRTRLVVALAVTFLLPSIICVLSAFAAGYAAVILDQGLAYHGLTVATTVVGAFFCFIVLSWLLNRLFKVFKPVLRRFVYETLLQTPNSRGLRYILYLVRWLGRSFSPVEVPLADRA